MDGIEASYTLSPLQKGMLFHALLAPRGGVYVEQLVGDLDGRLDSVAFERAWQGLIDRHPILRTAFQWEGRTEPLQLVLQRAPLPFERLDWSDLPAPEQERRLEELLEADRRRSFDLTRAPLLRVSQLRLSPERYRFVWTHHHILLDGWSVPLLFDDLFTLYEAFVRGADPHPTPRRPYRDYIQWLSAQDAGGAEAYWRALLAGFAAPTPLPSPPAPAGLDRAGRAERDLSFGAERTARLQQFARRHRLTLGTILQGAWALLLARTGGVEDVVFGTTVSGRDADLPGIEEMLGLFINTLPVRVRTEGGLPVVSWLAELQREQAERSRFARTSLSEIQGWSELPAGVPLFESLLVVENYPLDRTRLQSRAGLAIGEVRLAERTSYPLTLTAQPGPELVLSVGFDPARLTGEAVSGMLDRLAGLLVRFMDSPGRPVSEFDLLSDEERGRVLGEWLHLPPAGRTAPQEPCLHRRFEQQSRRRPSAVAVTCGGRDMTYAELDARAEGLARRLRIEGVGPESLVGVCVNRSPDLVVAILAVLKAGGAYVPLDEAAPSRRQEFILSDARVSVVLAGGEAGRGVPAGPWRILRMEEPANAAPGDGRVAAEAGGDALAYVIYTSGSTGQPKGVAVTHANASRLFDTTSGWFGFDEQDVWTLFHSPAFDFSVWEMWGALLHGGRLVVVPYWLSRSPQEFLRLLQAERVTVLNQTPSAFRLLDEADRTAASELSLRWIVFGGEALDVAGLSGWFSRHGADRPRLVNMYGITETTVHVTYRPLSAEDGAGAAPGASPIGGALPDLRLLLLDDRLRPVPPGVAGEIHVGGAGLARGYLGRPELTAERFIPDPFASEPGARLYRSGDRARRGAQGLEYLGRRDHQVKIRGFRIEAGEVEAALRAHPLVASCVAVVADDPSAGRQLVAYFVSAGGGEPLDAASLRSHLGERLPEAMIPAAFVPLEALPLTANGKIDRTALPAPERAARARAAEAPRGGLERRLASLWEHVLGLGPIGVNDNFFELGGDSILSIQVVARALAEGIRITPRQIFEHPTIAALAEVASEVTTRPEQGPVRGPVPLTPIQKWFFEQGLAQPHHWNQAVLLDLRAATDPARLRSALSGIVGHHDALRLRFREEGGQWLQWHAEAGEEDDALFGFDVMDLVGSDEAGAMCREGESPEAVIERTAERLEGSLDLERGPLVRAALFRTESGTMRLLLVVHHLVVDGVSWRVLLEDLATLCGPARANRASLPPKTTSFRRWAEGLGEHARSGRSDGEIGWWLSDRRRDAPAMPEDFPDGDNLEGSVRTASVRLDEEDTHTLLTGVPEAYRADANDALVAALAQALARWHGGRLVLITLEGHGREEILPGVDLSRTVGWFTTLYPVLLEIDPDAGPPEVLKSVKEQLRAVPGHGIGYGLLRYGSGDEELTRRLAALPHPRISFNYLGQIDALLRGAGGEATGTGRPHPFAWADGPVGSVRAARARRAHAIDVTAEVAGGCLAVEFAYSANLHREETIDDLAGRMREALVRIAEHCRSADAGGYTPSDFPDVRLDQEALDRLMTKVARREPAR